MESKHKTEQKEMSYLGFYTVSEFARFKGLSKQFISREFEKYETIVRYKRRWYKLDNGQNAEKEYGNLNKHIDKFLDFGFKKRMKSLAQNDKAIVDVKRINDEYVSIRFYNQRGDVLCCEVRTDEIELIEYDVTI